MNKFLVIVSLFLCPLMAMADTPPPGTVKAKTFTGDGNTAITSTGASGALDVNISSGSVTTSSTSNGNPGSAVPTQATQIGGSDGADLRTIKVSNTGVVSVDGSAVTQPVSAASLPLPTGAATSALQTTGITALTTINTTLGSPFQAGALIGNSSFGISGTLPAFASTPTFNLGTLNGASTAALQTTGNTALTTINTTLGSPMQASGGSIVNVSGTISLPTGAATSALQTTGNTSLSTISGQIPAALGAKTTANSMAVNIASDQTVTVSTASLPLPTGAATSALQTTGNTALTTINTTLGTPMQASGGSIVNVSGTVSLPTGASTAALQTTGNTALTTINTTLGSPMQASGGSVTANAGTNLNTSALALDTSVNGLLVGQGSTSSGQSGTLTQGAVTTSAPTYSTTKTSPLSLTTVGNLRVDGSSVTQPISATSLPLPTNASTSALQTTGNTALTTINTTLGTPMQASGGTVTVTQATGTNLHTVVDSAPTTAVTGTFYQTTQPVSVAAAITANAGTPTALTIYQAALTVGTSAVILTHGGAAVAATRVLLTVQLLTTSAASCYIGSSSVTTSGSSQGVQIFAGQTVTFSNDAGAYYAICGTSSQTILIMEQE